jgi:hypothetical protein
MLRSLLQLLVIAFSVLCCSSCGGDQTMPPDPFEAEKAKQNNKQVKENMRVAQKAAERFAADHGSVNYPVEVDDMFKTYFPGGTEGRLAAQVGPVNPFTSMNEFPVLGRRTVKSADELRHMPRFELPRGVVEYIPLDGGRAYAIIGGAHDNKVLMDELHPDQILVFSDR